MNSQTYELVLRTLANMKVDIDELVSFHKTQIKLFKPLPKGVRWGDLDDDEAILFKTEADFEAEAKAKAEAEAKAKAEAEAKAKAEAEAKAKAEAEAKAKAKAEAEAKAKAEAEAESARLKKKLKEEEKARIKAELEQKIKEQAEAEALAEVEAEAKAAAEAEAKQWLESEIQKELSNVILFKFSKMSVDISVEASSCPETPSVLNFEVIAKVIIDSEGKVSKKEFSESELNLNLESIVRATLKKASGNEGIEDIVTVIASVEIKENELWSKAVGSSRPAVSKPVSKPVKAKKQRNLPVVTCVAEFSEFVNNRKFYRSDFDIAADAFCPYTFTGEICSRVFECGKIHVQRCSYGDDCPKKSCSFMHSRDMKDKEASDRFHATSAKYSRTKAGKKYI